MKERIGRQYEICEFCLTAPAPEGDYVDIDFSASIERPGEQPQAIPGFYAGDGRYVVRFLPEQRGTYTYKLTGSCPALSEEGTLQVEPAAK